MSDPVGTHRGSRNRILWAHVPGKTQSPRQAQKKNDKSDRIKAFAGGSRPLHFQLGRERCTRCLYLEDAPAWRTSFDKLDKCVWSLAFVFGSRQFHFQHSHERLMQCNRLEDSPTWSTSFDSKCLWWCLLYLGWRPRHNYPSSHHDFLRKWSLEYFPSQGLSSKFIYSWP